MCVCIELEPIPHRNMFDVLTTLGERAHPGEPCSVTGVAGDQRRVQGRRCESNPGVDEGRGAAAGEVLGIP